MIKLFLNKNNHKNYKKKKILKDISKTTNYECKHNIKLKILFTNKQ